MFKHVLKQVLKKSKKDRYRRRRLRFRRNLPRRHRDRDMRSEVPAADWRTKKSTVRDHDNLRQRLGRQTRTHRGGLKRSP